MIRFEHTKVYNSWIDAIRGMRNSWESWHKSDSYETPDGLTIIGPNDYKLMMKLSKAGDDHGKYVRYFFVTMDIIAPEYWWREYATYKVGTIENSTSQMHTLGRRFLTMDDFSFDDPNDPANIEAVERVNKLIKAWWDAGKKERSPEWRRLLQNIPQSYNYRRTCASNYQVLKRMYHARQLHKLEEWREFCRWVKSLPCSDIITLDDRLTKVHDDAKVLIEHLCNLYQLDPNDIKFKAVIAIDRKNGWSTNNKWWYRVIVEGAPWMQPHLNQRLREIGYENVQVVVGG